jgi:hypothetical protein
MIAGSRFHYFLKCRTIPRRQWQTPLMDEVPIEQKDVDAIADYRLSIRDAY